MSKRSVQGPAQYLDANGLPVDVTASTPLPVSTGGGAAQEVEQSTHDDLNCNANMQVADADVGAGNPVPVSMAGGSVEVTQTTADDLKADANLQVGDVDVANGNPVPVSDAGGSLTVDGTVSLAGGAIEVTQTTHDDLNANANIQVGDTDVANGNPVPVSDAGGSLTVDHPTDLEVVQPTHDDLNANANVQFEDADVTASNPLPVTNTPDTTDIDNLFLNGDPYTAISLGLVPNASIVNKFGSNEDIDTGDIPEAIWTTGGLYNYPTSGVQLEIVSTDANDADGTQSGARTVTIQGLSTSWESQEKTVSMNGLSAVAVDGTWRRVFRAWVATAGSSDFNEGTITIRDAGGGTTRAAIEAERGQTKMAVYTVPAGKKAVIYRWDTTVIRSGVGGEAEIALYTRDNTISAPSFRERATMGVSVNYGHTNRYRGAIVVDELTDIDVRSVYQTVSNMGFASEFSLALLPNASSIINNDLPSGADDPVGWYSTKSSDDYTLDGTEVAQLNDKSGNGNHLTNSGVTGPDLEVIGSDNWLDFTGTELLHGANTDVDPDGGDFTYVAVFRTSSATASMGIFGKFDPANPNYGFFINVNNGRSLYFQCRDTVLANTGLVEHDDAGTDYSDGTKRLCMATYDDSEADLYLYGSDFSSSVDSDLTYSSVNITPAVDLYIGDWDSGGNPFIGEIAEILCYNRVLTASERSALETYLKTKWSIT